MGLNIDAYKRAAYPPPLKPPDVRDEDVAYALDNSAKRSKAAHKASETRKQKASKA